MQLESTQPEQEALLFTLHFLRAFENLDMPTFIACFAEDATAFFPIAGTAAALQWQAVDSEAVRQCIRPDSHSFQRHRATFSSARAT